jgi:hypothetical protein
LAEDGGDPRVGRDRLGDPRLSRLSDSGIVRLPPCERTHADRTSRGRAATLHFLRQTTASNPKAVPNSQTAAGTGVGAVPLCHYRS